MRNKSNYFKSSNVKKIVFISIILAIILGISVFAGNEKINNVTIRFSNYHEITVLTAKTKVKEILDENHIVLEENETVTPGLESEITNRKEIIITLKGKEPLKIADTTRTVIDKEKVISEYENIIEKIEVRIEEIPFETITKDVSNGTVATKNTIIQEGENGQRKITCKVTYKGNKEISREELSSEVIKEPVDKIVQIQSNIVLTSRGSYLRNSGANGIYRVTAYCACMQCCGKTDGITASGKKATANHTIAAPSTFAFGTKVKIDGQIYTVEDRGGAIQGNRIDVYMNSHAEALRWGSRLLELEVIE